MSKRGRIDNAGSDDDAHAVQPPLALTANLAQALALVSAAAAAGDDGVARIFLFALCGGRLERAEAAERTLPTLWGHVKRMTLELLESSPSLLVAVLGELFVYIGRFSPPDVMRSVRARLRNATLEDALEQHASDASALPASIHIPKSLLLPQFAALERVRDAPAVIGSTMRDMDADHRVAFTLELADIIAGGDETFALVAGETHALLRNRVILHMRAADLCSLGHEVIAHALVPTVAAAVAGPLIARVLAVAPPSFLVDVRIDHGARIDALFRNAAALLAPGAATLKSYAAIRARFATLQEQVARIGPVRLRFRQDALVFLQSAMFARGKTLYPYQRETLQWMVERENVALGAIDFAGGIVGLSPGMGKTRLTLSLIAISRTAAPLTVILVPKAVILDWMKENDALFQEDARLRVAVCHGEKAAALLAAALAPTMVRAHGADVIITTRHTFLSFGVFPAPIDRLVVDECHELSNPHSRHYKELRARTSAIPRRWGLTGTPFRNKRRDIATQSVFLGLPVALDAALALSDAELLQPVYQLGYGPDTVVLPPKIIVDIGVPLYAIEKDVYDRVYRHAEREQRLRRLNNFVSLVMALRQAAISMDLVPDQVRKEMLAAPVPGQVPAINTEAAAAPVGNLVFRLLENVTSSFVNWWKPSAPVPEPVPEPERPVPLAEPENALDFGKNYVSSRINAVVKRILEIHRTAATANDKIIVFSFFVTALKKLQSHLDKEVAGAFESALLVGETPDKKRDGLREAFLADPKFKVLMITYTAGGAGLNLQSANHVFEIDPCWNEGYCDQAEARAWRVGQTRSVYIYRFFAPNTFEERVIDIRREKARQWRLIRDAAIANGEDVDEDDDDDHNVGFMARMFGFNA